MIYDFEEVISREGTNSTKWDPAIYKRYLGVDGEGMLPLWVADMDFRAPSVVIESLKKRVEHGVFGYSAPLDDYFDALTWWQKNRHGWQIDRKWVTMTPGVVPGLNFLIRALSEEGDHVIIQQPVYSPFRMTAETNNRVVVNNELKFENGTYVMDYDDLEEKAKDPKAKLMILCSPHNPIGRIWTAEELRRLGQICNKHGVIVISDEIHNDLILPGNEFVTYASLGEEFAHNAVICTAPSKTFNLAAMQVSNMIIPNPGIKQKVDLELKKSSLGSPNVFGIVATTAAYSEEGADWLDQLLRYLDGNADYIGDFVRGKMPQVKYLKPQGTYLAWLDFRDTGIGYEELERRIKSDAKVLLDPGSKFGTNGRGFMRVNFACPRSILDEALSRIAAVL